MNVAKKLQLDQAVKRTRVLTGVLCVYAALQGGLYIAAAVQSTCATLTNLMAAAATTQLLSVVLMLMIATCIKKRSCYWCHIVLGFFLIAFKLVVIVVIAVQARPQSDSPPGCTIQRPTLAVMIAATIMEIGIIAVVIIILRRLRRSKALGLHNHTAVQHQKRFADDFDESDG